MNQLEILYNLSEHIKNTFIDTKFVESQWLKLFDKTKLRIEKGIHQAAFHTLMKQLFTEFNLSHCEFLTPSPVSDSAESSIPDFLKLSMKETDEYLYVRIPTLWVPHFDFDTVRDYLADHDGRKIILDLRLNTGGSLSAVGKLLGLFGGSDRPFAYTRLKKWREYTMPGLVYPLKDEENKDQVGDVNKVCSFPHLEWCTAKPVDLHLQTKIVALIGPSTFSCGELLAQGIQELKIGITLGDKTAGKLVLARDDFDLGYGYKACLPFGTVVSRERVKIEGKGVKPMINHEIDSSIEKELSHESILELLNEKVLKEDI